MSDVTWGGIIMAMVALIGSGFNMYNQRRAKRDTLEFDKKLLSLENELRITKAALDVANAELARHKIELEECRKNHKDSEADRNRLWERLLSKVDKGVDKN